MESAEGYIYMYVYVSIDAHRGHTGQMTDLGRRPPHFSWRRGGGGVRGMICSVMEAVQKAIHTECSEKSCCSAASFPLQLLLNSNCTQPDGVTKISHSGPGQSSIVHQAASLLMPLSISFASHPSPPPPNPTIPNYYLTILLVQTCTHRRVELHLFLYT